jgi:dolichol-phosphate mannosyltransferase
LLGVYVLYDWFVNSISHQVIATVGGIAIVLGIQLLMFGVLSDMIVTVNREQTQQLENIANRLNEQTREMEESDETEATAPAENRRN